MTIERIRVQPNIVQRQLIAQRDYDRLREHLRLRLLQCGWHDEMTKLCKAVINENPNTQLTVDDIVDKVTPQGRALVPDAVKKELLQKIKVYLMEQANLMPQKKINYLR